MSTDSEQLLYNFLGTKISEILKAKILETL